MVFSSLIFLYAFFPLSLLAYALCRGMRAKNLSLLISSLVFYAWGEPKYVLLLVLMAFVSWLCALRISRVKARRARRAWLAAACTADIALIGWFKYAAFFCSIFGDVPAFVRSIALPIGISFYTFQLLTYVADVYRGEAEAQTRYWNVLLYAALFHQCVAGPIVRYKTIAHDLFVERDPHADLAGGVSRFAVGLAKKTLLANACGALADTLLLADSAASDSALFAQNFETLARLPALGCWLGVLAFTLQIYLDFSAYSDMAVGMGKMLGLRYPENFDYPYLSRSAAEFWRRWHMTLGAFFRDYVYIPLGGRRRSPARNVLNLLIVWALTGLWHGASWNFVLWGQWYFVLIVLERAFLQKTLTRLPRFVSRLYLLAAVFFGWILFRFTDLRLGFTVFSGLFGGNGNPLSDFASVTLLKNNVFLLAVSAAACTPVFRTLGNRLAARAAESDAGTRLLEGARWAAMPAVLLLLATASLVGASYNPFIYFRF